VAAPELSRYHISTTYKQAIDLPIRFMKGVADSFLPNSKNPV
jgi:hypothetical protein